MKSRVWGNKNYGISQGFHSGHKAIDIRLPCGTPLYAPENGKAIYSQKDQYGGEWIRFSIKGGYFDITHLKKRVLAKGKSAKAGSLIGYSGTTGKSTACHLHFALNKSGWKEPTDYLLGDPCAEREAWHKNRYDALVVRYNSMKARYVAKRDELTRATKEVSNLTQQGRIDTELIETLKKEKSSLEGGLEALQRDYNILLQGDTEIADENVKLRERWSKEINWILLTELAIAKIKGVFHLE